MTFKSQGFFSPSMRAFRESLEGVAEFKQWFDYSNELVKYGLETLDGHSLQLDNRLHMTASALFVRAHKSFQAAIILSKEGLVGDARAVIRSATEGALALYAISTKPDFIDKLVEAKHCDDRKKARIFINDTDFNSQLSPEDLAGAEATIRFVSDLEAQAGYEFRDVKWAEVAKMRGQMAMTLEASMISYTEACHLTAPTQLLMQFGAF